MRAAGRAGRGNVRVHAAKQLNAPRKTASNTSMKAKLLTLILGLVTALAHADPKQEFQALHGKNGTLRDASGRSAFSASSTASATTYRDSSGRITATASGTSPDRLTYRDASGRVTGTASENGTSTTFRDASGRITGTAAVSGTSTTYRDSSGRIVGTASRTGDSITFRDASGRITGTGTTRK